MCVCVRYYSSIVPRIYRDVKNYPNAATRTAAIVFEYDFPRKPFAFESHTQSHTAPYTCFEM